MDIMTLGSREDWRVFRLGQVFRERKEKGSDKNFPPLSVTMNGIVPQLETAAKTDDGDNRKIVHVGDYVINSRSDRKGAGGISEYEGSVSLISIVLKPERIAPRFAHHLLRSSAFQEEFYRWGHGIVADLWTTRYSEMKNIRLRLPSLTTQCQIADFLDKETARIDLLIEKKKRLVELLVEREKTLIGECLARGIDPASEFKTVPQEWLGRIPSHWEMVPLKSLIWYQEGPGIMADDFREEGVPLLRIKCLSGQYATLQGCNYLEPKKVQKRWKHFRVELGDFLISASATRGGIASLVTEEVAGAVPYTGIIRIKPRDKGYVSEIIPYFLLSSLFDTQIDLLSAGSTIQHFGPTHLGRMKAPLPPQVEQRKIAAFLDKRVPLIREARARTEDSQVKLKGFRSALITAAVTGQIDVKTYHKRGETDQVLDRIEAEMSS